MLAYHTLRADMRTGSGSIREKPWKVGECRSIRGGRLELCKRGFHSSPTAFDTLVYIQGPVLCLVEISEPEQKDSTKQVSRTRKLLSAVNVEKELRLFACDCAERALNRQREQGKEPDARSWAAVVSSRAFAMGEISAEELAASSASAYAAAANASAYASAAAAATAAATAAAEKAWQRQRFDALVTSKLEAAMPEGELI